MATILQEIESAAPTVFRRAYIKRRLASTGLYESAWTEVTDYIKKWGTLETSVDDIRLNRFRQADLRLIVRNDDGAFNPETYASSLWNGYLTRYRTQLKLEGGYIAPDGTEFPTNPCLGVWLMDGEILINTVKNEATLKCLGITSLLETTRASEVDGIGATLTASEIIAKIRDHTDGSGNTIFRQIVSASSWAIQATTNYYDIGTTTSIEDLSVWDLMGKLAESEGYVLITTRFGGIEFCDRNPRTTSSQFSIYGEDHPRPNAISINSRKEAIDKFYSYVRVKRLESDTSTSWVQAGTSTVIDPSSTAWKYGNKTLEIENTFIVNESTAQGIADNLYNAFSVMRQEYEVACKFLPQVQLSDRVDINWTTITSDSRRWDLENWASDTAAEIFDGLSWDPEEGENFDLAEEQVIILKKVTDLDNMTTTLTLREV